ncbi:MAG TPA: SDR family oxidoreductase [Tepidisphaeraceae bacterium]|nr:SDR family oxidoreductase [Tepidisphaeraceae bacterium]
MQMNFPLLNKIALVTGASRGLGAAIALRLAHDGASLALVARDAAALESFLPRLRDARVAQTQQFRFFPADLSQESQSHSVAEAVTNRMGGVDILVNNAAIQGPIGALDAVDWNDWRAVFDVNLFAPALLSQLLIPVMRSRGGKIINVSGGGATGPRPDFSAYAASKCALVRLTETLAEEVKSHRIDVNAVAPGPMNTRMLDEVLAAGSSAAPREYAAAVERKRAGGTPPDKAAALVAWLASPASDGITGKLISAVWDDWETLAERRDELAGSEVYTLRRVTPKEEMVRHG